MAYPLKSRLKKIVDLVCGYSLRSGWRFGFAIEIEDSISKQENRSQNCVLMYASSYEEGPRIDDIYCDHDPNRLIFYSSP